MSALLHPRDIPGTVDVRWCNVDFEVRYTTDDHRIPATLETPEEEPSFDVYDIRIAGSSVIEMLAEFAVEGITAAAREAALEGA